MAVMRRLGRILLGRPITIAGLLPLASVAVAAPLSPAPQTYLPPVEPEELQLDPGPEPWARLHTRLAELTGEDFRQAASESCEALEPDPLDALILRAGSHVPPGLPRAVQERREAMRAEALALVAEAVQGSARPIRRAWIDRLETLLIQHAGDPRWPAAARTAAALQRYELAPVIAAGLDPLRPLRDRGAARAALFDLHRRWYEAPADFEAFWSRAEGKGREELFLDPLVRSQEESAGLRERLLELQPQREGTALLDHPDPVWRARAARALRRGVGEGRVSVDECIDALLAALDDESDAHALRAKLEALLQLLSSSPADSPRVRRLRATLNAIAERAEPELDWPVLEALTRLPWSEGAESDPTSLSAGILRVAQLFRRMVMEREVFDSDVLIQVVGAWKNLCARGTPAQDSTVVLSQVSGPAREAVRFVLLQAEVTSSARLAAAASISTVLPAEAEAAVAQVVELLERRSGDAGVEFELLRALGDRIETLEVGTETARRLKGVLMPRLASPSSDLRAAALEALDRTASGGLVDAEAVDALLARLEVEPQPSLQVMLLETLAAHERPELVDRILLSGSLDELIRSDPRQIEAVASALQRLAGDDGVRTIRSARRLLYVDHEETYLARLERALALVAALPAETARNLTPGEHRDVLRWAFELRERGALRPAEDDSPAPLLRRLVDVHLRGAHEGLEGDPDAMKHRAALFAGDLVLAQQPPGDPAPVLRLYEEALAYARKEFGGEAIEGAAEQVPTSGPFQGEARSLSRPAVVRRDRARFALAAGLSHEALADYRALLRAAEAAAGEGAGWLGGQEGVLQLADLRAAASLVEDPDLAHALPSEAAAEACGISLALVRQPAWSKLAPTSRVQDLRDLADRALASGAPEHLAAARAIFAELPALPAVVESEGGSDSTVDGADAVGVVSEEGGEPGGSAPLWQGLLRDRTWHEALEGAREMLFGAREVSQSPSEPVGNRQPSLRPSPKR